MYPSVCPPLVLLLVCCCLGVASASHILGVFVNVHRSQLLIHLAVARVLLQRGHQLTLVTTLPLEQEWMHENITHILVPWEPHTPALAQPVVKDNVVMRVQRTLSRLQESGELLNQPAWLRFMKTKPRQSYDLMLLGYHFNDHLLGVAAHFKCPVAIIYTQQPIGFVHSLLGNPEERWYVPQPYDSRQRTGLAGFCFGLWEKIFELWARHVMKGIYSTHFPGQHYPSFEDMRRRVVLALNNHHMISEGPIGPLLPSMLDIGGILLEQSGSVGNLSEIVEIKRPLIFFSLGTRFSWIKAPEKLENSFVDAFAQLSEYDIFWTYDGNNAGDISQAHKHIKLAKWWPQPQLLAHPKMRLFVSHGGKGSLSEALYHGVPMLGLPLVGDQRVNLRKMQEKQWGLTLDAQNLSQVTILSGLQSILHDDGFKKKIMRDSQLYRDRPLNASQVAAYWLEYVIRHKGAEHLYSPARDLNFIQHYLLDVRLLIYGSLIMLCLALIRFDRYLTRNNE